LRILDCSTVETTIESLSTLLKTDRETLNSFVENNAHRITYKNKFLEYKNLCIEDVVNYFNIREEEMIPDKIMVFHLTSAVDDCSFFNYGLLNLESVITEGVMNDFFASSNVEILYKEGATPIIKYKDKEFKDEMLAHRFSVDNCINGFLIKEGAENHEYVQHIRTCPEFICDMSRLAGIPNLQEEWERRAKPMMLSILVNYNDIIALKPLEYVLYALDFLVLKKASYWSEDQNYMIHLNEVVCISPENIAKVEELKSL